MGSRRREKFPIVRRARMVEKLQRGFRTQEWQLLGYSGSFDKAILPLVRYLERRGVRVE